MTDNQAPTVAAPPEQPVWEESPEWRMPSHELRGRSPGDVLALLENVRGVSPGELADLVASFHVEAARAEGAGGAADDWYDWSIAATVLALRATLSACGNGLGLSGHQASCAVSSFAQLFEAGWDPENIPSAGGGGAVAVE